MKALFFVFRWLRRLAITVVIVLLTLLVARAFQSRGLPDLKPWHRVVLRSEIRARDLGPRTTLADYLTREDAVFRELRERVYDRLPAADRVGTSRYTAGGELDPKTFAVDWNRSFQMEPAASEPLQGGVLLVHGLTDAPYSVRAVGEVFRRHGFYALGLRMPGHGTVPAALTVAVWEDWMAAVRLGVRAVRARIGPGKPLYLVGYSNGGALVLKYSLDALSDASLPRADRMVLLSPMIGVSRFAVLARFISRLGFIPYFEKTRWIDVLPEYIPFKYNSFPANAAFQTYRLTSAIQKKIDRSAGRLRQLPPILAFQSVEDATVSTRALVEGLFDRLEQNGSELVLFDLNRAEGIEPFLKSPPSPSLAELVAPGAHPFRFTVVSNVNAASAEVRAVTRDAGGTETAARALDQRWPQSVFSLSHVALPFPISDPLYGLTPDLRESFGVRLGLLVPRGERDVLLLAPEASTRLYSNPFFPYVEERLGEWIAAAPVGR